MKRKIISLARSTNVITLPNKWCEKNCLRKGDEVDISENGDSIVVSPLKIRKKIVIDISDKQPMIRRILGSAYKTGYDEMSISYSSHDELLIAQEVIQQEFIGFEVVSVEKDKKVITARLVSEPDDDNFSQMLRRMMLMIKDVADEIAGSYHVQKDLKRVAEMDKEVNKLADFCRRSINRNSLLQISDSVKHNPPLYFIVEQLENIGDEYRDLALLMAENPLKDENIYSLISDVSSFFEMFYNLFYSFSYDGVSIFGSERDSLKNKIDEMMSSNENSALLTICRNITEKTFDMNGPLMAIYI